MASRRGPDFERQCRGALEAAGFTVVRSAASKSVVDLIALGTPDTPKAREWTMHRPDLGEVWLVQCKVDAKRLGPAEWNALVDLAWDCDSEPILACQEKQGRRLVPAFYVLTDQRTPRSRTWPRRRVEMAA